MRRRSKFLLQLILILLVLSAGLLIDHEPAAAANSTLYYGAQGAAVTTLQNSLNQHGCICAADGIFGDETLQAVQRFQRAAGLSADGIVGPRTWEALGTPQSHDSSAPASRGGSRGSYTLTMVATGYCPCGQCNYPYGGKPTYMGDSLQYGIAAVDPGVISMGSHLNIEGYGYAKASDQGNAIIGHRIDLCFNSHSEALRWGIKTVTVTVMK